MKPPIPVTIVGAPSAASDAAVAAVARFLENFLAAEQPDKTWRTQVVE